MSLDDAPVKKRARLDRPLPTLDRVRAVLREYIVEDKPINRQKIMEDLSVHERDVRDADLMERAYQQGLDEATVDYIKDTLPKSAKARLDAVINLERKRVQGDFIKVLHQEVSKHIERLKREQLPKWREEEKKTQMMAENYRKLINNHQTLFTVNEFMAILRCLHTDSRNTVSDERLNTAFNLLNSKKFQLTGQK